MTTMSLPNEMPDTHNPDPVKRVREFVNLRTHERLSVELEIGNRLWLRPLNGKVIADVEREQLDPSEWMPLYEAPSFQILPVLEFKHPPAMRSVKRGFKHDMRRRFGVGWLAAGAFLGAVVVSYHVQGLCASDGVAPLFLIDTPIKCEVQHEPVLESR